MKKLLLLSLLLLNLELTSIAQNREFRNAAITLTASTPTFGNNATAYLTGKEIRQGDGVITFAITAATDTLHCTAYMEGRINTTIGWAPIPHTDTLTFEVLATETQIRAIKIPMDYIEYRVVIKSTAQDNGTYTPKGVLFWKDHYISILGN